MKYSGSLLVLLFIWSCQPKLSTEPIPVGPEPEPYRIVRDSVKTGAYMGITIGEDAASVYPKIQALRLTKGVTYLNIVGNIFADLSLLKEQLPLYQYILLDQKPGTDSGVQITIEGQTVKSIYLNSGQQLTQWPEKQKANTSVRVGDAVSDLYNKLINVRAIDRYTNKFDYISLLTKTYPPSMMRLCVYRHNGILGTRLAKIRWIRFKSIFSRVKSVKFTSITTPNSESISDLG